MHSKDYRTRYAHNLCKELPRIPCVKSAEDFRILWTTECEFDHLHINYESVEPYLVTFKKDKSTVIYNSNIIMKNIPLEAYEYIVNGNPTLEWVMERQCVKIDKKSGIVNDANRYAIGTIGNPAYPLELFQRIIL